MNGFPDGYPDNFVIVVDEYGDEVHDHPVTGMQVSWTEPSDDAINAAQLMAGKIIVCESEPEQVWSDCDFRDIDHGGPAVNHYRCKPSMHSRDISADNARSNPQNHKAVLLADGRQILVMCCNDCKAPIFYCDRDHWYHHLGWDVNPCFMHNEASWDLGTAGFQTEDGKPEPNEGVTYTRAEAAEALRRKHRT